MPEMMWHRLHSRNAASRGICVDNAGAMVGPGFTLVRRTSRGYRTIAAADVGAVQAVLVGKERDPDWLFRQCGRIADALNKGNVALAQIYGLHIAIGELDDDRLRHLARLSLAMKVGFNPDEPRIPKGEPGAGEWTDGSPASDNSDGGNAEHDADQRRTDRDDRATAPPVGPVAAARVGAAAAGNATGSLIGDLPPATLAGLGRLAAGMSGATAFLGTLFLPWNRSVISTGTFAGRPDLGYRYDSDMGTLRITQTGPSGVPVVIAEGHIGVDGRFYDSDHNPIGRRLPSGSVIVDPELLPGYRTQPDASNSTRTDAGAQAQVRSNPKLCPDPGPDQPGAKAKDIAYQQYVSVLVNGRPLPPGLAVNLPNPLTGKLIHFDDCILSDGTMVDAKGTGYLKQLNDGNTRMPWLGVEFKMVRQAGNQIAAAQGRPIEWHFAEEGVADYVRGLFADKDIRITILYTPWPGQSR